MSMFVVTGFCHDLKSFSQSEGRVWGHLGIVVVTLGGLGTLPAAWKKCEKWEAYYLNMGGLGLHGGPLECCGMPLCRLGL